jgi:hypothetical protein
MANLIKETNQSYLRHFVEACQKGNINEVKSRYSPALVKPDVTYNLYVHRDDSLRLPASRVIRETCKSGSIELFEWLLKNLTNDGLFGTFSMAIDWLDCFEISCEHGHIELAKHLYPKVEKRIEEFKASDIATTCTDLFYGAIKAAVRGGHLHIFQWLCSSKYCGIHKSQSEFQELFYLACIGGRQTIVELLYTTDQATLDSIKDWSNCFYNTCKNGHLTSAQFLWSKWPNKIDNEHFEKSLQETYYKKDLDMAKWLITVHRYTNEIVDRFAHAEIYNFAFEQGYRPFSKMYSAYGKFLKKLAKQVSLSSEILAIKGLNDIVVGYV